MLIVIVVVVQLEKEMLYLLDKDILPRFKNSDRFIK